MNKQCICLCLTLFLVSCSTASQQIPTPTPAPVPSPEITQEDTAHQPDPSVSVWYLGSNGWALRIGEKLLVFDYQERSDPNPPASGEARTLQRGYIDPDEIRTLDVYVFVTHSHQDHFDRAILDWQDDVDTITYFFGWKAGNNAAHHYMVGPRAYTQVGDIEVYTINSHHAGVPEVAFLVKVDGYTIYHNGDYRAEYLEDYAYLQTIADRIDIAFVIGHPFVDHPYFQQTVCLAEMFHPTHIFAMNREGDEHKCREFADLLTEHGVKANIVSAERRGEHFECPISTAKNDDVH